MKKDLVSLGSPCLTIGLIVGAMLTGCNNTDELAGPQLEKTELKRRITPPPPPAPEPAPAYVVQQNSGYKNWFYYGNRITSGSFTNSGAIDYTASALAASTGPLFGFDTYINGGNPTLSGDYYYAIGLLGWNPNVGVNGTSTITNNSGNTLRGRLTGTGNGLAMGIYSLQYYGSASGNNLTINNSGTVDGQVQNYEGTAGGIYHYGLYGGVKVNNNVNATCSATSRYYAAGICCMNWYGPVTLVNNGSATATATGGLSGTTSGLAYTTGVDLFSYDAGSAAPISFQNSGYINGSTTGGNTKQYAYGAFVWAEGGSMTFTNHGLISSSSTSAANARCEAVYCGGNRGVVTINNFGTIQGTAGGLGGWGLGAENDENSPVNINNSGTVTHNNGLGVAVFIGSGIATITNSGSISGGMTAIAAQTWTGQVIVNNSGALSGGTAMSLSPGNDVVNLTGLPTIAGTMDGNGGSNKLNFNLTGTLQNVNGATAITGRRLVDYGLGTSGNITVSGKSYYWKNFNVGSTTL